MKETSQFLSDEAAKKLRDKVKADGLTSVAFKLGVSANWVSQVSNKKSPVGGFLMLRIANLVGLEPTQTVEKREAVAA